MSKFKKSLIAIIAFAAAALFAGSEASANKVLRWAADAESGAPYVFQDPRIPSKLIGYEVDIINAVCEEIGCEPKFVQNQWDGLIPGLKRKDYDCAINGIEITDDRRREVNFSDPYYITFEQLIVKKGRKDIKTLDDLVGKKAGTLKGCLAERIMRSKGGIEVRTYDSEVNSFADLENGRLDAVLIDQPVAVYYAGWNPELSLVGKPIGEMSYGIAVRKEDKELLRKINDALEKMADSGKLREILEQWNMWNPSMALYLNDEGPSNNLPIKYEDFLESQGKETTFEDYVDRYVGFLPMLAKAALTTVELSILSMIIAVIVGLALALMRVYAPAPFSAFAVGFIELIRGTPLLIQLFFIFYALPSIGIKFTPFTAAIIGLGLNYAAYEAENYRAGLLSVPRGQMEAAVSLGMTQKQALKNIVIPQAIRLVIPPMTNDFISLLKDSSLVSVITMVELTKLYGQLASTYYDYIGTGIIVAIIYLLLGLPFVRLSKWAEGKFAVEKKKKQMKQFYFFSNK